MSINGHSELEEVFFQCVHGTLLFRKNVCGVYERDYTIIGQTNDTINVHV